MRKLLIFGIILGCLIRCEAQTFTSSPNQVCTEGSGLSFSQTISGLPASSSPAYGFYEISITLNHPKASDVSMALQSPAGTYIQLCGNNGGNANFTNAVFRLYASSSIRYSNAPFSGAYMAYDNMRDLLNYQDPNGIWTLYYSDNVVNGVTGTLVSWSVNFISNPQNAALNASNSNLPIFKIDVPSGYIPDEPKVPGTLKVIDNGSGVNPFNSTSFNGPFNLGIERQGYTSAGGDKPNYDFQLQTSSGSDTSIALLNLPLESDWIIKSCYTDEYMMKDPITFEMSRRMGYYAPRTRFIEVVLNGEYVGIYILEEKVKRDANRVNIAKLKPADTSGVELTGGYIFEINPNGDPAAWYSNYPGYQGQLLTSSYEYKLVYPHQNIIHPLQLNYIHSFVDSFEDALHGLNYQNQQIGWRKYASENDLINFLIVSEYSTNYDTYGRSTYLYKEKSTDGNKIHCGPPWDADRGYESDTGWVHIITHGYWIYPFWWQTLRTDSVFNKTLACRFTTLRNTVLTDAAFINLIDSNQLYIRIAVQRNMNRWQNYVENISVLKTNVTNRLAWMQSHLTGTVFPPPPLTNAFYCAGDPIDIFMGNQYTYNFQPGPDTSFFIPTTGGNYNAIVSSLYGCKTTKAITVMPHPQPVIAGNPYPCRNTTEIYNVTHIPGSQYIWTVNGGTPMNGCGINDSSCTVHWGNPAYCMVRVKQSLNISCTDSAIRPVTIQTCTSVHDIGPSSYMTVFPSPTSGLLNIQSDFAITNAMITDATGRVVLMIEKATIIDVSTLPDGRYAIKVTDEKNQVYVTSFLKE